METTGTRIKTARLAAGINQRELGAACGVSRAAVSQWELGTTRSPTPENIFAIAAATGFSAKWLATGKGPMKPDAAGAVAESGAAYKIPLPAKVPVLTWVQAGDFCESAHVEHPADAEAVPYTSDRPAIYGLRVSGPSMLPEFTEGEVIIVDPNEAAENGSFVIARKDGAQDATLKKLVIEGGDPHLRALNPDWPDPIIRLTEEWHICGVVIAKVKQY